MNNNMNKIAYLYGEGHPDMIANTLAEVSAQSVEENTPELYFDFSKSYIKSGMNPTFYLSGSLNYDFRDQKFSKSFRYNIEKNIRTRILEKFKEMFPESFLNIEFNLNLVPSHLQDYSNQNLFTDSSFVSGVDNELLETPLYKFLQKLNAHLKNSEKVGSDYKVLYDGQGNNISMHLTFTDKDMNEYSAQVGQETLEMYSKMSFGNDLEYVNVVPSWNPRGSMLFYSVSGSAGLPIDYNNGIVILPTWNTEGYSGKHSSHPNKYFSSSSFKIGRAIDPII